MEINTKQDVYDLLAREDELDEIFTLTLRGKDICSLFKEWKHDKKEINRLLLKFKELKDAQVSVSEQKEKK